ncbi:MAG: hypothetical protein JXR95_13320 [Deltaproteobacteria bacterium]|nr:hypothetical protein [Deltaproteobacteria bacterium]
MHDFFDSQSDVSHVKSTIVEKYFEVWAKIMIAQLKKLVGKKLHIMTWVYCHGCGSSAPVPCCNLKRVPEAAKHIKWQIPGCDNGQPHNK